MFQAIRGMHDILPPHTVQWQCLEKAVHNVMGSYGYQEIRLPIVEPTGLFRRSIGEVTDIVEKEMYTFNDRVGDSLSLRPEGTVGCVRAVIEHGLIDAPKRLWYQGPMFRHERPQKGRYRQFHQVGVEVLGLPGPDIDTEVILLSARLWRLVGVSGLELQINTLGTPEERLDYRNILVGYFQDHHSALDEDSRRRLATNPLRILDSKNPDMQELLANAPTLLEHLGAASQAHFATLQANLTACGLAYTINPRLVRGLDYYTRTVFEWVSTELGTQGTVCAGGRYDGLVEQLGGRPTPAVGFAVGMERVIALMDEQIPKDHYTSPTDLYLITLGELAQKQGLLLSEKVRDALPNLRMQLHCGGGKAKNQFKQADRSGATYALILGEGELERGVVGVKSLRAEGHQSEVAWESLTHWLQEHFA